MWHIDAVTETPDRNICAWSGNTVSGYAVDEAVVWVHGCGFGDTREFRHHVWNSGFDGATGDDGGIARVDSGEFVADEAARLVGFERANDVRDGVFVVRVVFGLVARDVDMNVRVPRFGVDVVVGVGCVEEVEVGDLVGCDAGRC